MANQYKSFYLSDIVSVIDRVAVDIMMVPVFSEKKPDGTLATLTEISNHNSLIAMHNEGVREMAKMLKDELTKEADGDD